MVVTAVSPSALKLTYFDFTGKAEPIRLAFHVGGITFEDERLSKEEFATVKSKLPFKQLPVLTINKEHTIAQSAGILRYAGALSGLYPKNNEFVCLLIDQVIYQFEDIFTALYPSLREQDPVKKAELRKTFSVEYAPAAFQNLEQVLIKYGGSFSVGDNLTIADLHLYSFINLLIYDNWIDDIPKDLLAPFKKVNEVYNNVDQHEKVQEYKKLYRK